MECTSGNGEVYNWDSDGNDEESCCAQVDLNSPKTQEKIISLMLHGFPCADKKGHSCHLQTRGIPVQEDIINSIRAMAPKGCWKSNSDFLRCAIAVGSFVMMQYLKQREAYPEIERIFKLYEMIEEVAKHDRRESLKTDFARAISTLNDHKIDIDEMVKILNAQLSAKETGS